MLGDDFGRRSWEAILGDVHEIDYWEMIERSLVGVWDMFGRL